MYFDAVGTGDFNDADEDGLELLGVLQMCETKTSVSTKPQIIDMEDLH
jgi:hypothetical protein